MNSAVPGDLEPLPGQLTLPGMPPAETGGGGQPPLPGLERSGPGVVEATSAPQPLPAPVAAVDEPPEEDMAGTGLGPVRPMTAWTAGTGGAAGDTNCGKNAA